MSSEENFRRLLDRIDDGMMIPASWLIPHLLKIAEEVQSRKLDHLINLVLDPQLVIEPIHIATPAVLTTLQIDATDLNIERIKKLFSLREEVVLWRLEEERYQVPQSLRKFIHTYKDT